MQRSAAVCRGLRLRRRHDIFTAAIERLEHRQLLTVVPAGELFYDEAGVPAVRMQWNGEQADQLAGRWILQLDGFRGSMAHQRRDAAALLRQRAPHISVMRQMGSDGLFLVKAPLSQTPDNVVRTLSKLPGYKFAEPDFRYELQVTPNDPQFVQQWGYNNTGQTGGVPDADIDAPELWDMTTGSGDLVVGMVDSGIDLTHPDLAANVWVNPFEIAGNGIDDEGNGYIDDVNGYDWWGNGTSDGVGDNVPADQNNHGSHTAGTVGALGNNGTGVTGVNWNVKLMALKIGGPGNAVSGADAVTAMNYVLDMRNRGVNVRLTNHSWGGGGFNASMLNAIGTHAAAGLLFVAAAGNNGTNTDVSPFYPACYAQPNILSIGNLTASNGRNSGSNFGAATVDLFAPGTGVQSTIRVAAGSYASLTGTSMASPHVAGSAAMAFNVYTGNDWAPVKDAIMNTTDAVPALAGFCVTGGRLNANVMLERLIFNQTGGVLTITGTISPDRIQISYDGANVIATVGPASGASSRTKTFAAASVNSVVVLGQSGNDTIEIQSTEPGAPVTVDAGAGTDTVNVVSTSAGAAVTVAPSAGDDTVNVNAPGVGTASAIFDASHTLGALNVGAGGVATMTANGNRTLRAGALSINASGKLDLNDNDLIFDYTGAPQAAVVQALVNAGRTGGTWLGNGITSTAARLATPANTTLGVMEATEYKSVHGAGATFNGQSIDDTAVLVKYTYYGDADFNGELNFDDYVRTDAGFNSNGSTWVTGDYDGNGEVNFDDYVLLDLAFNSQGPTL